MAGLLDWLSDAIGGLGNAATDPSTMGGMSSAGTPVVPPPPPAQQTDAQALANPPPPPGPAMPQSGGGIGSDAARAPNQPAIPPQTMPAPPPSPPGPPMNITPPASAGGGMLPPGATSTEGAMPPSGPGPAARSILGRALGLDPNTERRLSGGLAAGLTAAGNSSGKSPFQALASGAGATLSGQDTADDKTEDKQRKYLTQAIEAQKAGDSRELNLARTKLLDAQTKMTLQGKMGKDSVMNSDAQLYLRAVGATNADGPLKLLRKAYDDAVATGGANAPAAQAAKKAYDDAYKATLDGHLGRLGLDPKTADKLGKQPGMSQDNPVPKTQMTSQEAFDKLPPGSFFVNPKDGKILQKPLAPVQQPGAPNPAAGARPGGTTLPAGQGGVPGAPISTGPNLPPLPPSAPTNPVASSGAGYGAEPDDEQEAA